MNALPSVMRRRFEQVRKRLVERGSLPSNALQLACPGAPDAIVPRLLRAGADPESVTRALAATFRLPVYAEAAHGALEYGPDGAWAWSAERLFVADPFACRPLLCNPQLALPDAALRRYRGEPGLLPIQARQAADPADDPSLSPEAERVLREWLELAVDQDASDLHITPRDNESVEIRLRRNGLLLTAREEHMTMSDKCNYRLISNTLLTLSGNQHGVYNTPKDGSMELTLRGRALFIRVNMCPVTIDRRVWGSFTLRIVSGRQRAARTLDQLDLGAGYGRELRRVAATNSGLFLLTGPTGSGKTTTFYAVIMEILRRSRSQVSIKTLEDPIEVQLPGIDQIQINNELGMNYAVGLRALLRADPDVILIGEIRDEETAQLACRASLTGHLVLSTLHTKNSLGAIERLRNLGVPGSLIADTVAAVGAQRLVRQRCPHCAAGCARCERSGWLGRVCVAETLRVDAGLAERITAGASLRQLDAYARGRGFADLWDHARELIDAGRTTLEECRRALPAPHAEPDSPSAAPQEPPT